MNAFACLVKPAAKEISWLRCFLGFLLILILLCWIGGGQGSAVSTTAQRHGIRGHRFHREGHPG